MIVISVLGVQTENDSELLIDFSILIDELQAKEKLNFKGDEWELYNIKEDRTEQHNLISKYPEMAKELETAYFEWADKSDVLYFQKMWNTYNKNRRKDFKEYKTR